MRKKHHQQAMKPIERPLVPTMWRATLPLIATLVGCQAESIAPDLVVAEIEPARPGTNIAVDLAPAPEVVIGPEPPPPIVRWKPNPRPKPKAWIRPNKDIIDVAGW
jgi:hypothetical protein